jgi:hypothetical protein
MSLCDDPDCGKVIFEQAELIGKLMAELENSRCQDCVETVENLKAKVAKAEAEAAQFFAISEIKWMEWEEHRKGIQEEARDAALEEALACVLAFIDDEPEGNHVIDQITNRLRALKSKPSP